LRSLPIDPPDIAGIARDVFCRQIAVVKVRGRGDRRPAPDGDRGGDGGRLVGVNPVLEQIRRDPAAILQVVIARDARGGASRVAEAARLAGIAVAHEDARRLHEIGGGLSHQGVVARLVRSEIAAGEDLFDLLARKPQCVLVADQVTDPRNFGALLRSAEASGVGGVIVPQDRSSSVNEVVAKAAAGATAFLPVATVVNLARALRDLKDAGYWIVGLDGDAEQSLFDYEFPEFSVVVVGAEGRGLRALTRSTCDHLVALPMLGRIASLNVSVAAGIALFERVRQRRVKRVSTD
jgi:23S rRNA (guanosine2251-2'-O)-methyltransferase